jgi:putative addiction module component (TIGR02574 family)
MSTTAVFEEALKLDSDDRLRLIDALWASLGDTRQHEVEVCQLAEVKDRWAAYKRGEIETLDGPQVLAELKAKYAK